ncbi:MAG: hypothetical protein CVU52_01465 [Deltaproteobacteria bacterium HGW-Deltaproteobacteria-10]|nr:MAG: hypothetical protein CVU52_01465 [Deltaproteobacteria bacterium HGW-Deltaproteobacteria-10]
MWLYLTTGFYSVVHKPPCSKEELLVRTRSKVDIDKLQKLLKTKYQFDGEVIYSPKADYAYRMVVPRKIFASFISNAAMELDYDNFKNSIHGKDYQRHDAYMKCWEAMYEWQRDLKRAKMI